MEKALQSTPLDALPENVCLFLQKGIDTSTDKKFYGAIEHKSLVSPYSTITLESDPMDASWIDMAHSYMEIKVKAIRDDGGSVAEADFCPVNNLMHSLFSEVLVFINGTLVSQTNSTYPYVSLVHALFDTPEAERTYRTLALFKRDVAGAMNELRTKPLHVPITSSNPNPTASDTETDSAADSLDPNEGSTQSNPSTAPTTASTSSPASNTSSSGAGKKRKKYKVIGATNSSMAWRANFLSDGQEKTLLGKFDSDIFRIDRCVSII